MRPEDMVLVSTGDYVVTPSDAFVTHFTGARRGDAPRVSVDENGAAWTFQGVRLGPVTGGRRLVATDQPAESAAPGFESMAVSAYDPAARLSAMDADGVLAALSYPTFAGFNGTSLLDLPDRRLSNLVVSAYNDWQATQWAAADPTRLIPMGVLPVWDVDAARAEVVRLDGLGVTAVCFPESPYSIDLPSFATDYWDPVLAAICDADMALCLQMSAPVSESIPADAPPNPFAAGDFFAPQLAATACTDLIVSGVLNRFPSLRIAMSEGGIGWIPFLLDRIDLHVQNQIWSGLDLGGRSGTEVFRSHFLGCFTTDPSTLFLRERIGTDIIAWASGFPALDSAWPSSPERLHAELAGAQVPDEEINMMTWQTTTRFFRFDPWLARKPAEGTVAALRARVEGAREIQR